MPPLRRELPENGCIIIPQRDSDEAGRYCGWSLAAAKTTV